MTHPTRRAVPFAGSAIAALPGVARATPLEAATDLRLWCRQPAKAWVEALPLGSGRLGAMVFGGTAVEQLQLNVRQGERIELTRRDGELRHGWKRLVEPAG